MSRRGGDVSRKIAQISADASKAAEKGLFLAGHHLLGEAQEIVPNRDGDLERSGKVTVGDGEAAVSFDTPYAVAQHERLDYAHKDGRKAKYLETPMHTEKKALLRLMRDGIAEGMGFR